MSLIGVLIYAVAWLVCRGIFSLMGWEFDIWPTFTVATVFIIATVVRDGVVDDRR